MDTTELTELNEQQREAVEYTAGPLLVVAGAGTGKTTVIVERVLHLLDHDEGNILALTFTRKAAEEMRQRAVEKFEEHERRCHFSTFHSFCYDLLRKDLLRENNRNEKERLPRALDKIDQWIFFRRHLEDLELDYYLKVSEPGRFLHDLVDFCSRCHDNLVSPEDYREYVEKVVAGYDQRAREGKPLPDGSAQEIARLRELARIFERSEALQEQEGLVSFGAMISKAVSRLKNSPDRLDELRQHYRYILVDEFQDTNEAQLELVSLLAGERENVTVVGDAYQAIYRFRGASDGSFERFKERFAKFKQIELQANHRSTKSILDVAEALAHKMDRYDPKKKLTPTKAPGREVEVLEFADAEQQAEWVAGEIARMVESGETEKYSDVAVLYRKHNLRAPLVAALRRRDIPMTIRGLEVNKLPPVRDLVAYLRTIGCPSDSVSLARVLADPRWNMEADLLIEYCRHAGQQQKTLWEVVSGSKAPLDWPGRGPLLEFLGRYQKLAPEQRLSEWLEQLVTELDPRGPALYEPALQAFADFVRLWDQEKCDPDLDTGLLEEFLEYFTYFEEAGGVVALPEEEGSETAEGAASRLHAREGIAAEQLPLWEEAALGRVQLMTVHAAKGLEFEHVFLFHLVQRAFPVPNRQPLISLPEALWQGPYLKGDFQLEEERRLFYVGLTRAKRRLTLCTVLNEKQKPSRFLKELREADCPDLAWKRVLPPETPQPHQQQQEVFEAEGTGSRIAAWVGEAATPPSAEAFSLSASQLATYLLCPLKYHFSYGWRIPRRPSPALLFGSLMHEAVREVVRAAAVAPQNRKRELLETILNRCWPPSGFPDPLQERKYRERGLEQLEKVREAWSAEPFDLLYQEKPFHFQWGGTRLVGRIDQANRIGLGEVELIEYKSGRPQTQKEADHSLQLTVYAEACQQVFDLRPRRLILFNLTTGEKLQTTRTPQESSALEKKIGHARLDILAGKFPPQPGYHCRYCDFQSICPTQQGSLQSPGTFSPRGLPGKIGL